MSPSKKRNNRPTKLPRSFLFIVAMQDTSIDSYGKSCEKISCYSTPTIFHDYVLALNDAKQRQRTYPASGRQFIVFQMVARVGIAPLVPPPVVVEEFGI